jgi:hypothetical protein
VEAQEVVQGEVEVGDGREVVKSGVGSVPVIVVEEAREVGGTDGGVGVGAGVSPFAQGGLDEALGLAVGAWGIGAGEEMAQA